MAKIKDLEITSSKMVNRAINTFFAPSGSSVTIVNPTLGINTVFMANGGSGIILYRNGVQIWSGSGYLRRAISDLSPDETTTYTVSGGSITGGIASLK
jgi:hypothetical protein